MIGKLPDMSSCGVSNVAHLLHSVCPSNGLPKPVAIWAGAPCGISDVAQRVRNVFEIIDWQRSDVRGWRHVVWFSTLYNVPRSVFLAMTFRNGGDPATCDDERRNILASCNKPGPLSIPKLIKQPHFVMPSSTLIVDIPVVRTVDMYSNYMLIDILFFVPFVLAVGAFSSMFLGNATTAWITRITHRTM